MANLKKQEYYRKNREDRLKYQKDYYEQNRDRIKKARAKKMLTEPDSIEKEKAYNQGYYMKNKARIMEQRRLKRRSINRSL